MDNCNDIRIKKKSERFQLFLISSIIGLGMLGYLLTSRIFSEVLGLIYNCLDYETYKALAGSSIFQNAVYIVYALLCVVLPFVAVYFITRCVTSVNVPFNKPKKGAGLLSVTFVGLGVCVLGNFASSIFVLITESLFNSTPIGAPSDVTSASQISFVGFLVSIVSTAVVPALAEEFAIRGVVMQSLRKFGDKFAVVISALVFSIIHGNFQQIPFAFIVGLAFGYAVVRTNSIWAGVLLHFLNNFWSVCTEYASYLLPANIHAALYNATSMVFCVLAIIYAIRLYKKDVKNGITSGILNKPRCLINVFEKCVFVCCSPFFILGFGYLFYGALQNFAAV